MKIFLLLILLFHASLFATENSVQRGQTYYKFILKPMLGYDGAVFSKKFTKKEWQELFSKKAIGFKEQFEGESTQLDGFMRTLKFVDISEDLKAFAIFYAKDASVTPSCQE